MHVFRSHCRLITAPLQHRGLLMIRCSVSWIVQDFFPIEMLIIAPPRHRGLLFSKLNSSGFLSHRSHHNCAASASRTVYDSLFSNLNSSRFLSSRNAHNCAPAAPLSDYELLTSMSNCLEAQYDQNVRFHNRNILLEHQQSLSWACPPNAPHAESPCFFTLTEHIYQRPKQAKFEFCVGLQTGKRRSRRIAVHRNSTGQSKHLAIHTRPKISTKNVLWSEQISE